MAVITLSPLIVDVRNKVADMVFSKWKGINYVRSRVTPANPNTTAQQNVRNSMARCVDFWQALSTVFQGAWNYVASGRSYSGFNRFVSENRATEQTLAVLEVSPLTDVQALTVFTPSTGTASGEIDVAFSPDPVPAGEQLNIIARSVPTAGQKTVTTFTTTFAAAITSPVTLTGLGSAVDYQIYGALSDLTLLRTGISSSGLATSQT